MIAENEKNKTNNNYWTRNYLSSHKKDIDLEDKYDELKEKYKENDKKFK